MSKPLTSNAWLISQTERGPRCSKSIISMIRIIFQGFLLLSLSACFSLGSRGQAVRDEAHWVLRSAYSALQPPAVPLGSFNKVTDACCDEAPYSWKSVVFANTEVAITEDELIQLKPGVLIESGHCIELGGTAAGSEVELTADVSSTLYSSGSLFFVRDEGGKLSAIGSWDLNGRATCKLPLSAQFVTTGFGELSVRTEIKAQQPKQSVATRGRGALKFSAGFGNIEEGDLLRIGRLPAEGVVTLGSSFSLPVGLPDDNSLYRRVNASSDNFGAVDYLYSSILVTKAPVTISLEPGRYVVFVSRSQTESCHSEVEIKLGELATLTCNTFVGKTPAEQNEKKILRFDATRLALNLFSNSSFKGWLEARGIDLAYVHPEESVDASERELQSNKPSEDLGGALAVLAPVAKKVLSGFPGDFPALGFANLRLQGPYVREQSQLQFVRAISGNSNLSDDLLLERFMEKATRRVVALGGTGVDSIGAGATPFLSLTYAQLYPPYRFDFNQADFLASNGSLLEWIEPRPLNTDLVKVPPLKRFRFRVFVPPYNRTNVVEIYVNQKILRRLVVSKPKFEEPYEAFFDEHIDEAEDFEIALMAWGSSFLPEMIYGVPDLKPFAITRAFCVDVNANGKCDVSNSPSAAQ